MNFPMKAIRASLVGWFLVASRAAALAQQRADSSFDPSVRSPAYPQGAGPVVAVDEAHHNFHTVSGRYRPFADVLRADGYVVQGHRSEFTRESLGSTRVLVIANAGTDTLSSWELPAHSALTPAEIDVVVAWVEAGGSLFVIADHMPAAGAIAPLAARFGAALTNGYTVDSARGPDLPGDLFTRADRTLLEHPITRGRRPSERVDSIITFTGQAFQLTEPGIATVLRFRPSAMTLLPVRAGVGFDSTTPRVRSGGWPHAVTLTAGRGRVAIFGEAGMFSAQLAGSSNLPMGMNHPRAGRNKQLLLNTLHWLTGLLDPAASAPSGRRR
jgi:hypothetical protein